MTTATVVTADEGYFALYLDGRLEYWGSDEPLTTLAEAFEGRVIGMMLVEQLGGFGVTATEYEDPPELMSEIPERWWTDDRYVDGYEED